jgi:hypothetical protein
MPSQHRVPPPCKTACRAILLLFPLLALLLGGCATTPSGSPGGTGGGKVIDLGDFAVTAPSGDDWVVQVDTQGKAVKFARQKTWWTGKVLGATTISVLQNKVSKDAPLLDEEAEANRYREQEEQVMVERGVKAGLYRLSDVRNEAVTLDGRRYYLLRYKTDIPMEGIDWIAESVLYVHYPADFGESRVFYVFQVSDSKENYSGKTIDTGQIEPVLRSFRLKR